MKPDAIVRSVDEYGLQPFLQGEFLDRISEERYNELDQRGEEESLFSAGTVQTQIQDKIEALSNHEPEGNDDWKNRVNEELKAQIEILEELKSDFEDKDSNPTGENQ